METKFSESTSALSRIGLGGSVAAAHLGGGIYLLADAKTFVIAGGPGGALLWRVMPGKATQAGIRQGDQLVLPTASFTIPALATEGSTPTSSQAPVLAPPPVLDVPPPVVASMTQVARLPTSPADAPSPLVWLESRLGPGLLSELSRWVAANASSLADPGAWMSLIQALGGEPPSDLATGGEVA
jgi:hypothetical protein